MSDDLKNIVEAVLLVSDSTVNVARVQGLFDKGVRPDAAQVLEAIASLQNDCEGRGVELVKIGSGYRYQTREKYADYLRALYAVKPPRMSRALLETLAIVAYRQPVSRGDIEEVRGVSVSSEIMQKLVEREWIKQVGVRDVPGRPGLFGTTPDFLSYFNLESLKDLPVLMDERGISEIASDLDMPLPPELMAALTPENEEIPEDSDEGEDTHEALSDTDDDFDSRTGVDNAIDEEAAEGDEIDPGHQADEQQQIANVNKPEASDSDHDENGIGDQAEHDDVSEERADSEENPDEEVDEDHAYPLQAASHLVNQG